MNTALARQLAAPAHSTTESLATTQGDGTTGLLNSVPCLWPRCCRRVKEWRGNVW
jgi:hypothetical protein